MSAMMRDKGRLLRAAVFLAMVLAPLFSAPRVFAQSNDTLLLMNRLNDLESQVQSLNREVNHGGPAPMAPIASGMGAGGGAAAADLDNRISQIQDQIRNLTGEIEMQGNQVAQMRTENQRLNQDMQMRLNDLEAKVGGGGAPTPSAGAGGPATAPAASMSGTLGTLGTLSPGPNGAISGGSTPEKDYEIAYNALGQGDYASAESGFSAFLQRYPKHALAANAEYWLGETYFARNMHEKAAATFAESYKQYPNGAKAPDCLLKLGMSLGALGKTQQACLSFAELGKQFPAAPAKVKSSLAQERAHYKCQ